MILNFKQIEELFKEIDTTVTHPCLIFVIGGTVLLYQGLKPATKDIDIVVDTKKEFFELEKALFFRDFKSKLPSIEYSGMDISQILTSGRFQD